MRHTYQKLIAAVEKLDPAAFDGVSSLILYMNNGNSFHTDDVTVDNGMIFARANANPGIWRLIPVDELSDIEVSIDRAGLDALAKERHTEIPADLPGVLKYLERH